MDNQSVGVYVRLLCYAWEEPLPTDMEELAALVGETPKKFEKIWPRVKKCFTETADGFVNPRLEQERTKQQLRRKQQSDAGKKAMANRYQKPNAVIIQSKFSSSTSSSSPTSVYDTAFSAFWKAYPRRAGGNPKAAARKAWETRVEEESVAILQHGAERYAAYCEATEKVGTEYVKQAVSWLSPKFEGWAQDWGAPATKNPSWVDDEIGKLSVGH